MESAGSKALVRRTSGTEEDYHAHDHRAGLDNRPYRIFFASGDYTCSVARFTGTMTGPMKGPDGKRIPPTGKKFEVDFYTVAKWDDGQIVEENLMYDLVTFMKQIGLGGA